MFSNKRKICVVTGSRADYGLLYWLMKEIKSDPALTLRLVAAGMHLEKKYGFTYKQIIRDGFKIDAKVKMKLGSDTDQGISRSAGIGLIEFGRIFGRLRPDIIVLLGDRYEIMSAAFAAHLCRLPVAHIHGGEVTAGAFDDAFRHAITKIAYLHFVAHQDYARRVIQMGEDPKRVFNFGAPGLDNIRRLKLLGKEVLEKQLDFRLGKDVALVTYHPATAE